MSLFYLVRFHIPEMLIKKGAFNAPFTEMNQYFYYFSCKLNVLTCSEAGFTGRPWK